VVIVKGIMQEKHLADDQAVAAEFVIELMERVPIESARQKRLEMFPAQIDFDRPTGVQGKGQEAKGAALAADDAGMIFRTFLDRVGFPKSDGLLAIRADRLAGDLVPGTARRLASAARLQGGTDRALDEPQSVHHTPLDRSAS
jgi:hypothetical protein